MPHAAEPIDEMTMAAFIGGTLPEADRLKVVERLARDPEARDLLVMAQKALAAAQDFVERMTPRRARAPERPPVPHADRPALHVPLPPRPLGLDR